MRRRRGRAVVAMTVLLLSLGGAPSSMLRRAGAATPSRPHNTLAPGPILAACASGNPYVAVAVPKNRPDALAYVSNFVEDAKAAGSVRAALDRLGMKSSVVAPPNVVP